MQALILVTDSHVAMSTEIVKELRFLCKIRRECRDDERAVKILLTLEINKLRKEDKCKHKSWVCTQLAHRRLEFTGGVARVMDEAKPKRLPPYIQDAKGQKFDQSHMCRWPEALHEFWSGIYLEKTVSRTLLRQYMSNLSLKYQP